jgi:hypothetical protein
MKRLQLVLVLVTMLSVLPASGCFGEAPSSRIERLASVGLDLDTLVEEASRWVQEEREHHRPLAAQDAHLGGAYMKKYVLGWAENGFSYRAIPHEAQAFALADRFRRGEGAFSVAVEVARLFPPTVD